MTEPTRSDDELVHEAIRGAFPIDEGMPSESALRLHAQLRPVAVHAERRRRSTVIIGASVAASLLVVTAAFGVFAVGRDPKLPGATVSSPIGTEYSALPASPQGSSAVPALALKAISPAGRVLHFTSKAETEFGPEAGASTEEMWFDPKSGAGRLVRVDGTGKDASTSVIVSDGRTASVTTKRPGESPFTEPADMSGRLGRSFDKLATYRRMLESGMATVTAEGEWRGAKTYKLRAEVDGFGGSDMRMVMEAEIRADNYLPISCKSGFVTASGEEMRLKTREFSTFESIDTGTLPRDWFTPSAGNAEPSSDSPTGIVDQ